MTDRVWTNNTTALIVPRDYRVSMAGIANLTPNGNATIEATIVAISPPRDVTTKRGPRRVADATLKDDSGTIALTLWNEDTTRYRVGQKVKITDGWVIEFQGKLQIGLGRSGSVHVLAETSPSQGTLP